METDVEKGERQIILGLLLLGAWVVIGITTGHGPEMLAGAKTVVDGALGYLRIITSG